jgi:hypothetical protein
MQARCIRPLAVIAKISATSDGLRFPSIALQAFIERQVGARPGLRSPLRIFG